MAIYRNVSLSFWEDIKIVDDFTSEDRYFYLYLLTNPHTNLLGCYQVSFKQMTNETGYNKDTVEKIIDRMVNIHNVIMFDSETNEIFIRNWYKYNWTRSEKLLKKVEKLIEYVKSEELKKYLEKILNQYRVSIGYQYTMDTSVSVSVSDFNINSFINNNNLLINNNILKKLFIEYIKLREDNNYVVSETVISRLINKLEKANNDEERQEMLEQAINGKWKDLYQGEPKKPSKGERRVF